MGYGVHQFLLKKQVETPLLMDDRYIIEKIPIVADAFKTIIEAIGLNINDDSIKDTPERISAMYLEELFIGMDYIMFPKCTTVENKFNYDEMVTIKDIPVMSMCEHHFQPIDGVCKISYIPRDRVMGLSKFNRVVDFFCRRPQIQERLTEQIYWALSYILNTEAIAVQIDAVHYCVKARGVKHENCTTKTTKLGGVFFNDKERNEFLNS